MSTNDGTQSVEVDVEDTNLDDFSADFFGKKDKEEDEPTVNDPEAEEDEGEVDESENDDVEDADDAEEDEVESDDSSEEEDEEDEGEEADEEEDSEPEEKPKKNRKSAKQRISELTAEKRAIRQAYEAEVAALQARLAKLENSEPKKDVTPEVQTKDDDYPDPEAKDKNGELVYPYGELDPKYHADVVRHTLKKEFAERQAAEEARAQELRQQEEVQTIVQSWNTKLTEAEKTVPDLREKIAELEDTFVDLDPTFGQEIAKTIMQMDRGVEVLNYLADNISEAEAIVALDLHRAAIALGRIEGRLPSAEAARAKKKVSKAPKPPVTTRGSGVSKKVAPDTDDQEAFEREFFV